MSKAPREQALAVIKAALNAVPIIGGAIASLIGGYIPTTHQTTGTTSWSSRRSAQNSPDVFSSLSRLPNAGLYILAVSFSSVNDCRRTFAGPSL